MATNLQNFATSLPVATCSGTNQPAYGSRCRLQQPLRSAFSPQTKSRYHSRNNKSSIPLRSLRIISQAEPDNELRIPSQPPKSSTLSPSLWLSREAAVEAQLKALQHNNFPTLDHGIEVLYRFTNFDPFARSNYFGVNLDLGQYERFRRIFYTKCYSTLLNHTEHTVISSLEVAEDVWKVRVLVRNDWRKGEENVYEFTMVRRFGGKKDGVWFTDALKCDECEDKHVYGVI
jgi:hypothetical protein